MSNTVLQIAKMEYKKAFRSRSFRWLGFFLVVAFSISCLVSFKNQRLAQEEMQHLQSVVQKQWVDQPDRHPHRVAHYGYVAFRPPTLLSFFDLGVSEFTGNSVFLEAHVQNSANFSEAKQESSLLRFGRLTPAFLLQILLPLLIIFQCGRSITSEKQSRTLMQVLSMGVSWKTVLLGKCLGGVLVFVTLLIVPMTLVAFLGKLFSANTSPDIAWRSWSLVGLYFWYLVAWVFIAVMISARSQKSSTAVVALLGLWVVLITFLPKALPNLGSYLHAAPSRPELEHAIHSEAAEAGFGHNPNDEKFARIKRELLKKHSVDKVEDLPVNWRGIAMREGEKASAEIFSKHYSQLAQIFQMQNSLSELGAYLNPFLLVKNTSSAISGTDFEAATQFEAQAETYRYQMIQRLNDIHTEKIAFKGDKEQRVSSHHWEDFAPFNYQLPSMKAVIQRNSWVGWALLLQSLLVFLGLYTSPARFE